MTTIGLKLKYPRKVQIACQQWISGPPESPAMCGRVPASKVETKFGLVILCAQHAAEAAHQLECTEE